jgi:hypothetical protein
MYQTAQPVPPILGDIEWPSDVEVAEDAKQLIIRLLDEEPGRRLG